MKSWIILTALLVNSAIAIEYKVAVGKLRQKGQLIFLQRTSIDSPNIPSLPLCQNSQARNYLNINAKIEWSKNPKKDCFSIHKIEAVLIDPIKDLQATQKLRR